MFHEMCYKSRRWNAKKKYLQKIIIKKIVNIDDDKENFNEKIINLQNDELDDNTDLDGVD